MQVCEVRSYAVKRDMDLIREIMILINDEPKYDGRKEYMYNTAEEMGIKNRSTQEVAYHLALLIESGYVDGAVSSVLPMQVIRRLTWRGHEFLANIKNDDVWRKTKKRLSGLSNVALSVVAQIAEAEIKRKFGLS